MRAASALAFAALVALCSPRLHAQDAGPASPPDRIVVDASGFRSDRGHVRCALYASADDFPRHAERAVASVSATIRGARAVCAFLGVAPGTYAVSLHHDEDDEGDFDTGIFGIPTEGVGASRDARGSMGPPSFRDAQFEFAGGELELRVRMQYVF